MPKTKTKTTPAASSSPNQEYKQLAVKCLEQVIFNLAIEEGDESKIARKLLRMRRDKAFNNIEKIWRPFAKAIGAAVDKEATGVDERSGMILFSPIALPKGFIRKALALPEE